MNANTIEELRYLPPELGIKVCTMILLHESGNTPATPATLADAFYLPGDQVPDQFGAILQEMMGLGWLHDLDTNGCHTLTAAGVKVAADFREYYEAD